MIGVLLCVSSVSWASQKTLTYRYDEDFYSQALIEECDHAAQQATTGLRQAERNLGLAAGTLSLDYGLVPEPMTPHQSIRQYSCMLQFSSTDTSVGFASDTTKARNHLSKEEQSTACQPDLDSVASRPGAVLQEYNTGWTLFQGRLCDVDYVEASR
jgi:hypothetical protein